MSQGANAWMVANMYTQTNPYAADYSHTNNLTIASIGFSTGSAELHVDSAVVGYEPA